MTYEQQNLAWQCLPSDAKKEVKQAFSMPTTNEYEQGYDNALVSLFGIHNLTSDADGEEMLYAKRSDVIKEFDKLHKYSYQVADLQLGLNAFRNLYGSKCLPDENIDPESLVTTIKDSMEHPLPDKILLDGIAEPKPAEPKFKVGDKVKDISSPHDDGIYKVDDVQNSSDGFRYHIQGLIGQSNVKESDLEPYTEPSEEDFANAQPKSVGSFHIADEETHLRNYSRDSNRLQIAAMAMQGILTNGSLLPHHKLMENEVIESVASLSVRLADTLIAECGKGGSR